MHRCDLICYLVYPYTNTLITVGERSPHITQEARECQEWQGDHKDNITHRGSPYHNLARRWRLCSVGEDHACHARYSP